MMSRIQHTFRELHGQTALITYLTAGDPDAATTVALMHTLADNGADIIELGVPFSDPMADGPVIQRAAERALAKGTGLNDVLDMVRRFRADNAHTPVVLMGYLNPVHKMGYQTFAAQAADAGVDGVLTVDCPIEHITPLHQALHGAGLETIFLVAPTTTEERMAAIAAHAGGFIYYVSLKGVTGAAHLDAADVAEKLARIRRHSDLPVGVGFGISTPEHAQQIAQSADAVIIGSRIVAEIEANGGRETEAVAALLKPFHTALRAG